MTASMIKLKLSGNYSTIILVEKYKNTIQT